MVVVNTTVHSAKHIYSTYIPVGQASQLLQKIGEISDRSIVALFQGVIWPCSKEAYKVC